MEIVKAKIDDAEKILEIQKIAYLSEARRYNDFGIPPLRQTLDELKEEFNTHIFLKAVIKSELVGSIRCVEENGSSFIGRLIVLPNFQRKGIGSALLSEIEKYFEETKRFELFTGTSSTDNLRLYQRHGYKEYKVEPLNNNISLIYMEKFVNNAT